MNARNGLARLSRLEFPRRFPLVQFPNMPLGIALVADVVAGLTDAAAHRYLESISWLAFAVWAWQELTEGVNWFRRLLGLAFGVLLVVRLARAIHS